MSSKRYIFDTDCRVMADGIKVRGQITVTNVEGEEIRFPHSEWHSSLKEAFSESYDIYISELAKAVKR